MIRAVVAFVRGKRSAPPPELQYVFDFNWWHVLPNGGGLRDQPAGMMNCMRTCWAVYQAVKAFDGREKVKTAKWKKDHPKLWEIVSWAENYGSNA